jgi:hypothetical protein
MTDDVRAERSAATVTHQEVLQGHAMDFADPDLWPEAVDGAELLAELTAIFDRHLALPDGAATCIALWVLHAHAHDAAEVSPILGITSPTKGCGKTLTLELVSALVPRPLSTSNITTAALFRAVERFRPTVLADEADTYLTDREELRGVLNSGHRRGSAQVIRTVGNNYEPRKFRTWAPKAIAKIGDLPETLADRSIIIHMRRSTREEEASLDPLRLDRLADYEPVRQKAWRWAQDNLQTLRQANPIMPQTLRGRAADNWRPLLAIADLAGADWPNRARQAALSLYGSTDPGEQENGVQLLSDLRDVFDESGEARLSSKTIVARLIARDDRPWGEWRSGRPITLRQIARLLRPFRIKPRDIRFGTKVLKGYERDQFADAWSRYLPDDAQQPRHPSQDGENAMTSHRNMDGSVADADTTDSPGKTPDVADVANRSGRQRGRTRIPACIVDLPSRSTASTRTR